MTDTRFPAPVRWIALTLITFQVTPLPALAAVAEQQKRSTPVPEKPPAVKVNRTAPAAIPAPTLPTFSSPPQDAEITRARVFDEPLIPIAGSADPREDSDLAAAIDEAIQSKWAGGPDRFSAFVGAHPSSRWNGSVLLGLGIVYRRTGYFSRALDSWQKSWDLLKNESDPRLRALADRAVGELAELEARLGRADDLERLFDEIKGRDVRGGASEKVESARAGYAVMKNEPERAFLCGPFGLDRILASTRSGYVKDPKIADAKSTPRGTSMLQILELADSVGFKMQLAQRTAGAAVVVPALVHWKAGHFAALTKESGNRLLIQDPTFGGDLWITRAALDDESTGYFLVPAGELPAGWRKVASEEGKTLWGKGIVQGTEPDFQGSTEVSVPENCQTTPMAQYKVNLLTVNLHVWDAPVGYTPPVGPAMEFTVAYNLREQFQPQIPLFSNFGPKWTFHWFSYTEDDPANPAQDVTVYRRGGGRETYTGMAGGTSVPNYRSQAILVRTSSTTYERRLPDGSLEIFGQADGSVASPRRIYLTQSVDPQGNHATLSYSYEPTTGGRRLVSATDAIGQVTTFAYSTTDPLRITKVTDPFGRFATFDYDSGGHLQTITDVIGITSSFGYGDSDSIIALMTPYGSTTFVSSGPPDHRSIETTDPVGGKERIEFVAGEVASVGYEPVMPTGMATLNGYIGFRNTFFWDKRAMALYPGDYTKAQIYHWLHLATNTNVASGILESEKLPLERRVWYNYPGQTSAVMEGSMRSPSAIGRVLDDGTTQLYRYEYNSLGKVTKTIDPLGRETVYEYDTNAIDLLNAKRKNGASYELLESRTYNAQHRPLTVTDAAGQTTTYSYNTQGQLLTMVTPSRDGLTQAQRTTTYGYETDGYLQSVTGPTSGDTTSYTYDGYGRVRTVTDADAYAETVDYDALDRVTKVTYPDATYKETVYNRLDAEKRRDRLGRWSQTFYDALRRPVAMRDPLGRTTTQQWCNCGSLEKLVDANNNATTWEYDVQGRATKENRANASFRTFTYENTTSRLKSTTDAKSQTITYTYNLDDNASQVTYTNEVIATPDVSYSYDSVYNRLTGMTDGTGTTSYTYHPMAVLGAGRVKDVDGPLSNDTVSYTYDELGRVKTRSLNGSTATWNYDNLGRLTSQVNPLGTFTSTYEGTTARVATLSYPNGQQTTNTYFGNSKDRRLQTLHNQIPATSTTISRFDYDYDAVGNITWWKQQAGSSPAQQYEFGFDAADQITRATLKSTDPTPVVLKRYGYAYDSAGNRTTEQVDDAATQSTHDNMNRLASQQAGGALLFAGTTNEPATVTVQSKPAATTATNTFAGRAQVLSGTSTVEVKATDASGNVRTNTYQVTQSGGSQSLTYDANGNLTADGTKTYEWNADDRLVAVKQGVTTLASFTYDGYGRRAQKTAAGVTTTHVYAGDQLVEERLSTGGTIRYWHGPWIDDVLAKQDATGAVFYYAKDHLGSVREVTDASGVAALTRDYDPWGKLVVGSSSAGYAFTGREWDPETGLYYYRGRYYDPKIGRFISEDPIGLEGGVNLFRYVENDPVALADPYGLEPCCRQPDGSYRVNPLDIVTAIATSEAPRFYYPDGSCTPPNCTRPQMECVAFTRHWTDLPSHQSWRRGPRVWGNDIPSGTAVAAGWGANGRFPDDGGNSGIYVSQNREHMLMYDQWPGPPAHPAGSEPRKVYPRDIHGPSNDARAYYVIIVPKGGGQ